MYIMHTCVAYDIVLSKTSVTIISVSKQNYVFEWYHVMTSNLKTI